MFTARSTPSQTPRLVQVLTRMNIGGPARQAAILNEGLRTAGFHTELVTGSAGDREGEIETDPAQPPIRIPQLQRGLNPVIDGRAYMSLGRLFDRLSPDIVHTHLAKAGALGRVAAARTQVPVVVHTFHGHVLKEYFSPLISQAFLTVERRLAGLSDALVAVSCSVRDELLGLGIGREEQWRVVPLGLDLEHLMEGLPKPGAARRRLGISDPGPCVGIVGRLAPIKDHATFFEACAQVAKLHPTAQFVVAGDGELRDELERTAGRNLGDRVHFLGWVSDLPDLYAALDVVVLTSRNEGTPVALIEAAAAGRAVVSTQVGGVTDVVFDGKTGFLAAAGDSSSIAARIMTLLENPRMRATFGEVGRQHVSESYASQRHVRAMADLYGELLERKAPDSGRH